MVKHHDDVRILDRREPVRDDEHRAPLHELIHAALHERLRAGVDGAGRLVEDHDRRIGHSRACDAQQLPLALAQAAAVAFEHGVVAVGQHADEMVGIGKLRRRDAFVIRRVRISVADIFHDRTGKEIHVLEHDAEAAAQICLTDLIDVDAVVADLAVGNVVKAVDKVRDRRLARTGRADEGDLLAGFGVERDVMQDLFVRRITEVDVIEHDAPGKLRVCDRAVAVRVLPRPETGVVVGLGERAVFLLGVDKRHIAVVRLRLGIHERENARCAGQCCDDGVELVGDLRDRVCKPAREREEGCDHTERERVHARQAEVRRAGNRHRAADDGDDDILQVTYGVHHRHHAVGHAAGARGVFRPDAVAAAQLRLALLLVAEDLDDLLAVDHLLNIAVEIGQRRLLRHEVAADAAGELAHEHENERHDGAHDQRQPDADVQHAEKHCRKREHRRYELRHGLRDHLAQRIGIVRIQAHDVAVRMRIKIADGQALHLLKHLVTDALERALRDRDHAAVIQPCGQRTDKIYAADGDQRTDQAGIVRRRCAEHGHDIAVDQLLQEHGRGRACDRAQQDADRHEHERALIGAHIRQQALERPAVKFRAFTHRPRLPSAGTHRPRGKFRTCAAAHRGSRRRRYARHRARRYGPRSARS